MEKGYHDEGLTKRFPPTALPLCLVLRLRVQWPLTPLAREMSRVSLSALGETGNFPLTAGSLNSTVELGL